MLLALLVLALVAARWLCPRWCASAHGADSSRRAPRPRRPRARERRELRDPGRERRAEQRARELLRSCVNDGGVGDVPRPRLHPRWRCRHARNGEQRARAGCRYAYLIYPHKPIVAYVPRTGRLLSEYCVEFPDLTGAISGSRLPDSDDVLAKWMALTGDERRLIRDANMHLPGRQIDPGRMRRDLWRLAEWERRRGRTGRVRLRRARAVVSGDPRLPSRAILEGPDRAAARAYLKGIGFDDEALAQADHRHREHLDRDDAVQLPPARGSPSA